jgi:Bacterial Ig domain
VLNGPTVYGGYGCDASAPIPERDTAGLPPLEPGEEAIVVLQRGPGADPGTGTPDDPEGPEEACFPGEKAENGIEAGYDAVLLVNHHRGEAGGVFCGSGDFPATPPIVAPCTTHEAYHHIFGTPPTTEIPYNPANEPDIGDLGEKVRVEASFDGWGYAHLYDAQTSEELDAFAIPEALDARFASGFGDLSIHEFATDPTENLAYSSYYSGGMRVLSFDRTTGLQQQAAFIDDEGSNFWGVEQFTTPGGQRLISGSDRDFGLQIFRYTGPGAAKPPTCSNTEASTGQGEPVTVQLTCTDENGNPLTRRIVNQPSNGRLGPIEGNTVLYTPNTGNSRGFTDDFVGRDTFTFAASDGAAESGPATATVQVRDTDAPSTRIAKKPKNETEKRKAKFRFRSDEPDAKFECKLDKKKYKPCKANFKRGVGFGKHKLKVRAIDAAGNVDDTPAKDKWRRVKD